MRTVHPQIPKDPLHIDDFSSYAQKLMEEELPITEIESSEERINGADYSRVEIKNSIFKNCTFHNCSFENASFIDVVFISCDLSNSKLNGAYFERCLFQSCKCVGIDMSKTVLKQTAIEQSNFEYSNFNQTKMTEILFDHVNFSESSMAEAKLKGFSSTNSKFVKNNFFKTMLATVDFTNNEFAAPTVSTPPIELKGAVVNIYQAADLISLYGVIVKQ